MVPVAFSAADRVSFTGATRSSPLLHHQDPVRRRGSRQRREPHEEGEGGRKRADQAVVGRDQLTALALGQGHDAIPTRRLACCRMPNPGHRVLWPGPDGDYRAFVKALRDTCNAIPRRGIDAPSARSAAQVSRPNWLGSPKLP